MRQYTWVDNIICQIDKALSQRIGKACNSDNGNGNNQNTFDKKLSISLMRVNHTGEICAQALYHGQALVARDKDLERKLNQAAEEEQEHLNWCRERIQHLGGKTSLLNPLFAAGSFGIGVVAGLSGDKISLGFIAETEHQVMRHLDTHLSELPLNDSESREILMKMHEDECRHATNALQAGGAELPMFIRKLMSFTAKIMTISTRYV